MDLSGFRSLQEAYLRVYEEFVDPEEGEAPSGRSPLENVSYHPKASVRRKAVRAMRKQMEKEYGGKWKTRSDDPVREEVDTEAVEKSNKRNLKSGMTSKERLAKHRLQRGMKTGQSGREYAERQFEEGYVDLYDNIPSHLLDEGKVPWDDKKNPNPSGYTPKEKSEAKRKQLGVDNPETKSFEEGGPGEKEYARHSNLSSTQKKMSKRGQQPKGAPHRFKKDKFWNKTKGQIKRTIFGTDVPKDKKSSYPSSVPTTKEELDIYDIILSHLLDEGYANDIESAEVIMVNMSDDWRVGILEGLGGAKNQGDYEENEAKRQEIRDEHLRKYESGELPFQKQKKAEKAQEFLKKHPKNKK